MSETYHRESVVVQQSDMHEQCDFTNYESWTWRESVTRAASVPISESVAGGGRPPAAISRRGRMCCAARCGVTAEVMRLHRAAQWTRDIVAMTWHARFSSCPHPSAAITPPAPPPRTIVFRSRSVDLPYASQSNRPTSTAHRIARIIVARAVFSVVFTHSRLLPLTSVHRLPVPRSGYSQRCNFWGTD